jgi:hypothetical protein
LAKVRLRSGRTSRFSSKAANFIDTVGVQAKLKLVERAAATAARIGDETVIGRIAAVASLVSLRKRTL